MKAKLIRVSLFFAVALILLCVGLTIHQNKEVKIDLKAEQIIALNEIKQLIKLNETQNAKIIEEKIEALHNSIKNEDEIQTNNEVVISNIILCVLGLTFIAVIFIYVYFAVLHPFEKMKVFTEKIAQGDFSVPLNYQRSNYFGDFTWAFDSMRKEILKARSCEHEAVENNKTVIATLSHDIKSPIASIRAYAEGLEANLDKTPEKRSMYLNVIIRKCDEVAKLTDDLFLHSISDLEKLKITPEHFEICEFLQSIISEISAEQSDITFKTLNNLSAWVIADKNRITQITENLINNSRKYAKSIIDISIECENGSIFIRFKDYGDGIPDEDMPFIFNKFYRGKNCNNQQGSGLGLFIVQYLITQMDGQVLLQNNADGLEATIILPITNIS